MMETETQTEVENQDIDWGQEAEDLHDETDEGASNVISDEGGEDDDPAPAATEPTPAEEPTDPPTEEPKPAEPKADDPPAAPAPVKEEPKKGEGETEPPKPKEEPAKQEEVTPPAGEAATEVAGELETKALGELEKVYQLSEEEKQAFDEDPVSTLPKIAARLHWRTYNSVIHAMSAMLPQALSQHTQIYQSQNSAEQKFYEAHPELNDPAHTETVLRHIRAYKAANPGADLETTIGEAGVAAKIALKLHAPAAPAVPEPKPHQPARPGGTTAPPPKTGDEDNPWAKEFEEDLDES